MSNVPIIVLREGSEDVREKEARYQNIRAMVAVTETVKSTLGPKGMDKMLVDNLGDATITNDGAEILKASYLSTALLSAEDPQTAESRPEL